MCFQELQYNSSAEDEEQIFIDKAESDASEEAERIPNLDSYLEVTVNEPLIEEQHTITESGKQINCLKRPLARNNNPILNNRLENSFNYMSNLYDAPDLDECSLYGQFLAKKLRVMDEDTRDLAMVEIHKLLYNIKKNSIDKKALKKEHDFVTDQSSAHPSSSHE